MRTAIAVVLALLASFCFALGSLIQQGAARQSDGRALRLGLLVALVRDRRWLGGMALTVFSFAVQAAALAFGPLALVQPLATLDLLFALPLIARLNRRPLTARSIAGGLCVAAGMAVFVGISPPGKRHRRAADQRVDPGADRDRGVRRGQRGRRAAGPRHGPGHLARGRRRGHLRGTGRAHQEHRRHPVAPGRGRARHLGALRADRRGRPRRPVRAERLQRRAAVAQPAGRRYRRAHDRGPPGRPRVPAKASPARPGSWPSSCSARPPRPPASSCSAIPPSCWPKTAASPASAKPET